MKNGKTLKEHPGKILLIVFVAIFSWISSRPSGDTYNQGYNFPRPDPSKGHAWGFDYKKGDYRYESNSELKGSSKTQNHLRTQSKVEVPDGLDMDIDEQEVRDYYAK